MADPAEQLQRIYVAGFEVESPERFPGAVRVAKGNCTALLRAKPGGLELIGEPGWRIGTAHGVLVEKDGKQFFQHKLEFVEATGERLAELRAFGDELGNLLTATS